MRGDSELICFAFVLICQSNAKRLRSPCLLDEMHPMAVLFFHLFYRMNFAAKVCELGKFELDCL